MRAGWDLHPLHFSMEPVTGPEAQERTMASLQHLGAMDGALGVDVSTRLNQRWWSSLSQRSWPSSLNPGAIRSISFT